MENKVFSRPERAGAERGQVAQLAIGERRVRAALRLGRRQLLQLVDDLSERDRQLLLTVQRFHLAQADQLQELIDQRLPDFLEAFLATPFGGERHVRRVEKLSHPPVQQEAR